MNKMLNAFAALKILVIIHCFTMLLQLLKITCGIKEMYSKF